MINQQTSPRAVLFMAKRGMLTRDEFEEYIATRETELSRLAEVVRSSIEWRVTK